MQSDGREIGGGDRSAQGARRSAGRRSGRRVVGLVCALLLSFALPRAGFAAGPDTPTSNGPAASGGFAVPTPAENGIAGRVVDRAGRPQGGVVVLVRKLDPPPTAIPELANATDRRGRFFWPLPPGRYALTFVRDGRTLAERRATVGAGAATRIEVIAAGQSRP